MSQSHCRCCCHYHCCCCCCCCCCHGCGGGGGCCCGDAGSEIVSGVQRDAMSRILNHRHPPCHRHRCGEWLFLLPCALQCHVRARARPATCGCCLGPFPCRCCFFCPAPVAGHFYHHHHHHRRCRFGYGGVAIWTVNGCVSACICADDGGAHAHALGPSPHAQQAFARISLFARRAAAPVAL